MLARRWGNTYFIYLLYCGEVTESAEGARLLSELWPKATPGFESLPLRHFYALFEKQRDGRDAGDEKKHFHRGAFGPFYLSAFLFLFSLAPQRLLFLFLFSPLCLSASVP